MTAIRHVHAGDLSTKQAHALVWNVGSIGDRFQEIAIVGDKVVGSWTYSIEWRRGRTYIDSSHTDVMPRYRRKGVARALWLAGIALWNPTSIQSTIGTDEGKLFLARMMAEVAYRAPGLHLSVKTRDDDDNWDSLCDWEARQLLSRLGERGRATAAKQIEAKQPLRLVKGSTP